MEPLMKSDLVQARTTTERKKKAERVLKKKKTTMSAVINQLLIYIDEHKELPFDMPKV